MKNFGKLLLLAAGTLLFLVPSASADSVVYINGSYAFGDNGYGIPPYGGTLDGQAADFYCVDFSHDIGAGYHWTVNATDLTASSSSFGGTYLNNKNTYLEFAYLIEQMTATSDLTAKAADQWAIWSLTGGTDPYTGSNSAATLLGLAQAAVNGGYNGAGWQILTPGTNQYGQEFLVKAPEPSSFLSLGIGLFGLCGLCLFKRRQQLGTIA